MLSVENLSLSYDGRSAVLDGLDFVLHSKEIVIVGGATGSGKSTLARCISGFVSPDSVHSFSGSISIDKQPILSEDTSTIARNVALIQQDVESQICTLQVIDEIAFGPENFQMDAEEIQSIIPQSLESVDALYLHDRSTFALSGGEKQRIVIASMLAGRPDYLVLDEPTSSLDPKGVNRLRNLLIQLREGGMGILCIEHSIDRMASVADRMLTMSSGKLIPLTASEVRKPLLPTPYSLTAESSLPLIRANHICYSYGTQPAVDDLSLSLFKGEVVALMGDNGSGKSTLLHLLSGLLSPDTGTIHIEHSPLEDLGRIEKAQRFGIVFQNPNHQIFERTVWSDQILSITLLELNPDDFLDDALELLKQSGLGANLDQNPFSLSFGQKRRLNLTSLLYLRPQVLFLDEPFIGQDAAGIEFICERVIQAQKAGTTTVVATHDPWFVSQCCTRVLFMRAGSILVDGSPKIVLSWLEDNGESWYADIGEDSE